MELADTSRASLPKTRCLTLLVACRGVLQLIDHNFGKSLIWRQQSAHWIMETIQKWRLQQHPQASSAILYGFFLRVSSQNLTCNSNKNARDSQIISGKTTANPELLQVNMKPPNLGVEEWTMFPQANRAQRKPLSTEQLSALN